MKDRFTVRIAHAGLMLTLCQSALASADLFELSLEDLQNVRISVASGFEESVLDAASSVSLIQREDWMARGARRNMDALEASPGVNLAPSWAGGETISIRGYTTDLSVRGIATLIDGVPVNMFTYGSALYDKPDIGLDALNRIELIRGPGSTLYGSDAFHGVLAYTTYRQPKDHLEVRSELGSNEYASAAGRATLRQGNQKFDLALDGRFQGNQERGYEFDQPFEGDGERAHRYRNGTFNLNYQVGDRRDGLVDLGIMTHQYHSKDMPGSAGQFFAGQQFQLDRDHMDTDSEFMLYRLQFTRALRHGFELNLHASHWETEHEWIFDGSRYEEFCAPGWTDPSTQCLLGIPGSITTQHTEESHQNLTLELKQNAADLNTQWVAAVGYRHASVDEAWLRRDSLSPNWSGVFAPALYDGADHDIDYALLQARTTFMGERLQLVYGARFDDYSDVGSHTSPRLGIVYRLNDYWALKSLYGNAFRSPTAIEIYGSGSVISNPDLEPEEIDTYELVAQYQRGPWQWEVVGFRSRWDNAIRLTSDASVPVGSAIYRNSGESRAHGSEMSLNYLGHPWRLHSNITWVQSENTSDDIDYVAFPRWLLNLGIGYALPDERTTVYLFQHAQLDQYSADYLSVGGDWIKPEPAADFWRVDLNLSHRLDASTQLFCNVRNLLDRDNVKPSLYNGQGGIADEAFSVSVGIRWQL
ncbi:MAG: TonB-dependent receptor [Gammaproteobacteria bacterium]